MRVLYGLVFILFASPSVLAQTTLYACEKDGVALLQDTPIENCSDQKTYQYESFNKRDAPEGLRESEKEMLQQMDRQWERSSYVDPRVGGALWWREMDRRQELCHYYKSQIERTLVATERLPEDHFQVRQAMPQLKRDHRQYQYYCGASYPKLNQWLTRYYQINQTPLSPLW